MEDKKEKSGKKIKILAFRFNAPMQIDILRELRRRGVEIIYWCGLKKDFDAVARNKEEFPETIFHSDLDAVRGIPALGVSVDSFVPVGKDLLNQLLKCESQVLTMMNTIDTHGTPLIKKKHIYYKYVRYWYGIFQNMKPDAVIFGDVPHMAFQYVVYCLAKLLGIKVVTYIDIQVEGRLIFLTDTVHYQSLAAEYARIKNDTVQIGNLNEDIQNYYKKQIDFKQDASPWYMKREYVDPWADGFYKFPVFRTVIKNIQQHTLLKTTYGYVGLLFRKRDHTDLEGFSYPGYVAALKEWRWKKIKESFKKEHKRFEVIPNFSKKFVYVPLHFQPERSTSALGDVFVDQILMIEILSAALPKGWVIYVKENPLQWKAPRAQAGRFKGYYEELARIPHTHLVPVGTSTFDLIKKSCAVATVTSTAGWEAILRGKPALVFGSVFYMYCEGVFKVSDMDSCVNAFSKIENGFVLDRQKVINFLAAVDAVSVRGYINDRYRRGQELAITDTENAKNIAGEIYKKLLMDSKP